MATVISLFSGIGGSTLGYKMAGFKSLAAVEFLTYQANNYLLNNPETKMYEADIRSLSPEKVLEDVGLKVGELDLLDGSPPCASFSLSGSRQDGWSKVKAYSGKKQRTDDLFFEYIRFLKYIQPKMFIAENVSGLVKGVAKGYFKMILSGLKDCGYVVRCKVMNAKYYGVPQSRERLIFVGVRNDIKKEFKFPEPSKKIISCGECLADLEQTEEDIAESRIREDMSIYPMLLGLKPGQQHPKRFNLMKQHPNQPCHTITQTGKGLGSACIHHWDNRAFTIKELKRICSFPDDFKIQGRYRDRYEGFGRAVPPKMMYALALQALKVLSDN
jgi:DNA (cytosine-5)-methyltransferase 1